MANLFFEPEDEPWNLPKRLDRVSYLMDHLVWEGYCVQMLLSGNWAISTGEGGRRLIALWPTEEAASVTFASSPEQSFKRIKVAALEEELLSELYEDEFIAVFPNHLQEYEIYTTDEFRQTLRFYNLRRKDLEGTLCAQEAEELASRLEKLGLASMPSLLKH